MTLFVRFAAVAINFPIPLFRFVIVTTKFFFLHCFAFVHTENCLCFHSNEYLLLGITEPVNYAMNYIICKLTMKFSLFFSHDLFFSLLLRVDCCTRSDYFLSMVKKITYWLFRRWKNFLLYLFRSIVLFKRQRFNLVRLWQQLSVDTIEHSIEWFVNSADTKHFDFVHFKNVFLFW